MNNPRISQIVAMSQNHVIAKDGKLPWHISTDLKRYRAKTTGHVNVMGRKTYDSIGRPLPNRVSIVVTRDPNWHEEGVVVCNSFSQAIEKAKEIEKEEIFIIGGGEIFKEAMPITDRIYLTLIHQNIEGDTFYPDYSDFKKVVFKEDHEENGYKYTFLDLERS